MGLKRRKTLSRYEPKTRENAQSVHDFLQAVENPVRRKDSLELLSILTEISPEPAKMWGTKIVGFGRYRYRNRTCEGEWMRIGFSPGKRDMSIYIMPGFSEQQALLDVLGPHKHGVSCLNITRLDTIDMTVLQQIMRNSLQIMAQRYPEEVR